MIQNRGTLRTSRQAEIALDCIEAGIDACHPRTVLQRSISFNGTDLQIADSTYEIDSFSEILVIGGGKAGGEMARGIENVLGDTISAGIVVTTQESDTSHIDIVTGGHPVPTQSGVSGTQSMLDLVKSADEETLIICLISGGGSALMTAPVESLSLDDLQQTTNALLASGADIHEINAVRKHLSAIKGGQLARACAPATVVGIVLSDVVGNDLDVIASGPLVPDESSFINAKHVIETYDLSLPDSVSRHINQGVEGAIPETPDPEAEFFDRVSIHLLADNLTALRATAERATAAGYTPIILSSRIRGEAREAAKTQVAIAEECVVSGNPATPPVAFVSGGETTVTIEGEGTGGPNQEFVLSAALELQYPNITIASVDTDGIDGPTDIAGGIVSNKTLEGYESARSRLADNDASTVLEAVNAHIQTGPTGTNVNDLRLILVDRDRT